MKIKINIAFKMVLTRMKKKVTLSGQQGAKVHYY
jgi:hypothetical protein